MDRLSSNLRVLLRIHNGVTIIRRNISVTRESVGDAHRCTYRNTSEIFPRKTSYNNGGIMHHIGVMYLPLFRIYSDRYRLLVMRTKHLLIYGQCHAPPTCRTTLWNSKRDVRRIKSLLHDEPY